MVPGDRSDPENVERIARILRAAMPDARIAHIDPGEFAPVEFRIEDKKGIGFLVIDWACLQEDQVAVTEEIVRMYLARLAAGLSWRIRVGRKPTQTLISRRGLPLPF
jgi:hypothetical protein